MHSFQPLFNFDDFSRMQSHHLGEISVVLGSIKASRNPQDFILGTTYSGYRLVFYVNLWPFYARLI